MNYVFVSSTLAETASYIGTAVSGVAAIATFMVYSLRDKEKASGPAARPAAGPGSTASGPHAPSPGTGRLRYGPHPIWTAFAAAFAIAGFAFSALLVAQGLEANSPALGSTAQEPVRLTALCLGYLAGVAGFCSLSLQRRSQDNRASISGQPRTRPEISGIAVLAVFTGFVVALGMSVIPAL